MTDTTIKTLIQAFGWGGLVAFFVYHFGNKLMDKFSKDTSTIEELKLDFHEKQKETRDEMRASGLKIDAHTKDLFTSLDSLKEVIKAYAIETQEVQSGFIRTMSEEHKQSEVFKELNNHCVDKLVIKMESLTDIVKEQTASLKSMHKRLDEK